jgi:hypothetical protein
VALKRHDGQGIQSFLGWHDHGDGEPEMVSYLAPRGPEGSRRRTISHAVAVPSLSIDI